MSGLQGADMATYVTGLRSTVMRMEDRKSIGRKSHEEDERFHANRSCSSGHDKGVGKIERHGQRYGVLTAARCSCRVMKRPHSMVKFINLREL
jgi:hypothetical protein